MATPALPPAFLPLNLGYQPYFEQERLPRDAVCFAPLNLLHALLTAVKGYKPHLPGHVMNNFDIFMQNSAVFCVQGDAFGGGMWYDTGG